MSGTLVIDAGNSNVVAAIHDGSCWSERTRLATPEPGHEEELARPISAFARRAGNNRVLCSSVVPRLHETLTRAAAPHPVLFVSSELRREFDLAVPNPKQIGADRLANAAASLRLAKPPLLIVDAGTATTFDVVDARPAWTGGTIVCGPALGLRALAERTALLSAPRIARTETAAGRTTEEQLRSGATHAQEALIEAMADRLIEEAGFSDCRCIATGGCLAFLRLSGRWRQVPDLTLEGIRVYGELNA